ncbi:MAG: ribosome maturation factor RimM [Acidobacteriota bacterium]
MVSSENSAAATQWLIVGRVGKPHGVHGGVLVEIITDFPERMVAGLEVGLGPEEGPERTIAVHGVRYHRGRWLIDWVGIRSRDEIESWRGLFIFLPEQSLDQLPDGYYYEHHLVGLECRSPDGKVLGTITGLDLDPGQIRAIVRRGTREYLVPWVPEIVKNVDLDGGVVTFDPPRGLLDDDAEMA